MGLEEPHLGYYCEYSPDQAPFIFLNNTCQDLIHQVPELP